MALGGNFDAIDEAALKALKANGLTEGPMLEFKRETYGRNDDAKRELLKDVSSLANTMGGHLIIGIDEVGGVAGDLMPLTGDADAEKLRLEEVLREGLQPRVIGLKVGAVAVAGGWAIVIRVPRSLHAPHRVAFKGLNKFYARNSAGCYELGVEELRAAFTSQVTANDKAAAFRAERLAIIAAGEGPVDLDLSEGALVVHIIPHSAFLGGVVDVDGAHAQGGFVPLDANGWSPRLNFEGYICVERGAAYTQLFRNGPVEAVVTGIVRKHKERRVVPGAWLEGTIIGSLSSYLASLAVLEVSPPALIGISLLGVADTYVYTGADELSWVMSNPSKIRTDRLELPAVMIEDWRPMPDLRIVLRRAIDALWNASGASRAHMFNSDGQYVGAAT